MCNKNIVCIISHLRILARQKCLLGYILWQHSLSLLPLRLLSYFAAISTVIRMRITSWHEEPHGSYPWDGVLHRVLKNDGYSYPIQILCRTSAGLESFDFAAINLCAFRNSINCQSLPNVAHWTISLDLCKALMLCISNTLLSPWFLKPLWIIINATVQHSGHCFLCLLTLLLGKDAQVTRRDLQPSHFILRSELLRYKLSTKCSHVWSEHCLG